MRLALKALTWVTMCGVALIDTREWFVPRCHNGFKCVMGGTSGTKKQRDWQTFSNMNLELRRQAGTADKIFYGSHKNESLLRAEFLNSKGLLL